MRTLNYWGAPKTGKARGGMSGGLVCQLPSKKVKSLLVARNHATPGAGPKTHQGEGGGSPRPIRINNKVLGGGDCLLRTSGGEGAVRGCTKER